MYSKFQAKESVKIPVTETAIPIQHYLRQPQRLVKAIANPQLTKQLSDNLYELKMRPINFMGIYHFQPIVVLKVWAKSDGTVMLKSESCQIQGIEYINRRFSLNLKGILTPQKNQNQTVLEGEADLTVKVDIPAPLLFTPKSILENTGNKLLKNVLSRIKQRLISQLLQDYSQWTATAAKQPNQNSTVGDLGLT